MDNFPDDSPFCSPPPGGDAKERPENHMSIFWGSGLKHLWGIIWHAEMQHGLERDGGGAGVKLPPEQ